MSSAGHAHHDESFITKYIFSTDHKMIGRQYTLVGLVMAFVGGFLAYGFRMQLAYPNQPIPLIGNMDALLYNQYVTTHGLIMFFWVAMPVLVAGVGNFLIPLMIGTDDMAFPKLNMLSFWIFFLSTVVLIVAMFAPKGSYGGGIAGGWTLYPPLSADAYQVRPEFLTGLFSAGSLLILAVALEFVSILMGGINFLVTTINMRADGMKFFDMPIVVWFVNLASLDFMFSVGPLIAGAVMLLFDRVLGTGFYDPARGGDPVLFQHLFWFFGHPEVYVVLLPSLGMLAEIITTHSRKSLFAYKVVVVSAIASAFIALIVWAHHQFIAGIDPRMATFFSITTIIISIPFAIIMFAYIATLWGGSIEYNTPMLWAMGVFVLFLIGGVTGIYLGSSAFDIYMHDSYFVVAHFHYVLIPIVFFGGIAGIYHWFPKFFGRKMNETLGKIHFWLTFISFNLFAFPLFYSGSHGMHRRIFDYSDFEISKMDNFYPIAQLVTIATIVLVLSQFLLVINMIISAKGGEVAGKNPWKSSTLEWQADSPPPHGNFQPYPKVNRGPYEYNAPGRDSDFWPQNE